MRDSVPFEIYNDLQQFKQFFNSLLAEDRSENHQDETDFDLESFLDESWTD